MDKGAHYYNCDFQVHSPRDRGWTGSKFGVNEGDVLALQPADTQKLLEEREQFAKEYLNKIRLAGLNAIAITDHHDVVFAKLIRRIAEEENQLFIDAGEFEKVITIFPGIELTLANPVSQCLLIFDADFPDANLDSVINFLGINPTHEFDKHTIETSRISQEIVIDLVHLHKKLDETFCKGRYIVLPNVGDGGKHSILRQGFHEHYRKMPCVGGYVDKEISNDRGYQNKINGGDVHYGNKSIGLISTSDNRYEDGREFGKYATWIKWGEPTAEAIRQACLAKESRISQDDPELPQIFINSVDVTNSKFLGAYNIELNQQYNALIGGRGTGKSTILEYIRWALCDQTSSSENDESSVVEKRRESMINKTLTSVGGEVRVTMSKNGILHIVKRNSSTNEILLKIGEADFVQVKESEIRKLLPIQSYSQKQLSDVGVRTEELKRFIEHPILDQLNAIKFDLGETSIKLKGSYNQLIRKKEVEAEIENYSLEISSLTSQVESIRKSLKGVNEADQTTISKKNTYETEQIIINNSRHGLRLIENKINDVITLLDKYPEPTVPIENLENKEIITALTSEIDLKYRELKHSANAMKALLNKEGLDKINAVIQQWEKQKQAYEVAYEIAKGNSQSSQQQLLEIQKIEARISEINRIISERKSTIKEIGTPEIDFDTYSRKWQELHQSKISLLNEQSQKFTLLSKNIIKAEITRAINLKPFWYSLKSIFEGTRIREERIDAIIEHIRNSADPLSEYIYVIKEFQLLAEFKVSEDKSNKLPELPILTLCGYTDDHKLKLCNKFNADNWLSISASEVDFDPQFFYTTNNQLGDVIPFGDASAGQQATALLTVLLNQPGIPLLIDQPEDDIDNKAIDLIIKNIWEAKKRRQLIFTSHNANLVVNGDAELVVCCDYKDSNSQTRGHIKAEGAIDNKKVKLEITSVMEGGEKAFRLRKDKYGF